MTATEQRLRELLQATAPHFDALSPDLLETQRRRPRLPLAIAAAVVLVAALALVLTVFTGTTNKNTNTTPPAHSSPPPPATATGHIQGTLLIVPPLQRQYPTSGTIMISGPRQLTRHAGKDGRFSVTLPAGRYAIIGHTPKYIVNGRQGDCTTQTNPTIVHAHQTVHVTVICSEK